MKRCLFLMLALGISIYTACAETASGFIALGKITSDLSTFQRSGNSEKMTVALASLTVINAQIKITAGNTALYAEIYDNPTARDFIGLLPLTLKAFDRIGLVKSTVLPQPISDEGERTRKYARGAVFYWPEGPEVAFCYSDHLPETVVDIIHIGMIESGVEFFQDYAGEILIELTDSASM
jgi:hypothetical protein